MQRTADGEGDESEEARMSLETYRDKWALGPIPELQAVGRRVINTYYFFHNQRTHDFPMAYRFKRENIDVELDGPEWVDFFENGWDALHRVLREIQDRRYKREHGTS